MLQQPIPVGAETRVVSYQVINRQPNKPAVQQVVADLFDRLPFTADRSIRVAAAMHESGAPVGSTDGHLPRSSARKAS